MRSREQNEYRVFKLITSGCLGLLVSACSTSPVSVENARRISESRIFAYSQPSTSSLIVTRDEGVFGVGVNYNLYINGKLAAEFAAGEVATFGMTPGRHILGLRPATMFSRSPIESEFEIKVGETVRRRISLDGAGPHLTPTAY